MQDTLCSIARFKNILTKLFPDVFLSHFAKDSYWFTS